MKEKHIKDSFFHGCLVCAAVCRMECCGPVLIATALAFPCLVPRLSYHGFYTIDFSLSASILRYLVCELSVTEIVSCQAVCRLTGCEPQ